jgi:hypothetical protein
LAKTAFGAGATGVAAVSLRDGGQLDPVPSVESVGAGDACARSVGVGLPITPLADGGDNRALMSASGQLSRLGTMLAVLGGLLSLLAGLSAGVGDSAAWALRLTAVK